jgi:5'-3' exonuclease
MKVLVDHMNFFFRGYHLARRRLKEEFGKEELLEEDMGFVYHILIKEYNYLFKTYGNLIICHEGKGSLDWRRKIYDGYKRNRDGSKEEQSYLDLKKTFPVIDALLDSYPTKQIKVDGMEADDVMFALAIEFASKDEDVLVISTDKDMIQLKHHYDNIDVYSPIKRQYYEKSPNIVMEKAICGDASDNIPGLYRVGPKTLEKMLVDKDLWRKKMANGNKEIYETFLEIVDLSRFPKEKHEEAVKQYYEKDFNLFDPNKIELFYYENKLNEHLSRWGAEASDIIDELVNRGIETKPYNPFKNTEEVVVMQEDTEVDDFLKEFI